MNSCLSSRTISPVTGWRTRRRSISSPNISIRTAFSSYIGMTSIVSPRTRNVPRVNARSFRVYWISTSRRSSLSRSNV